MLESILYFHIYNHTDWVDSHKMEFLYISFILFCLNLEWDFSSFTMYKQPVSSFLFMIGIENSMYSDDIVKKNFYLFTGKLTNKLE